MRRHLRLLADRIAAEANDRREAALAAAPFRRPLPSFLRDDLEDGDEVDDLFLDHDGVSQATEPDPDRGPDPGCDPNALPVAPPPPPKGPPFATVYGLSLEELPPAETLLQEELNILLDALLELLGTYGHHFELDPEEGCPDAFHYTYLLELLASPSFEPPEGYHWHGCQYWAPECSYGEWCKCTTHWTQAEFEEQGGLRDLAPERFMTEEQAAAQRRWEAEEERRWEEEDAREREGRGRGDREDRGAGFLDDVDDDDSDLPF